MGHRLEVQQFAAFVLCSLAVSVLLEIQTATASLSVLGISCIIVAPSAGFDVFVIFF